MLLAVDCSAQESKRKKPSIPHDALGMGVFPAGPFGKAENAEYNYGLWYMPTCTRRDQ